MWRKTETGTIYIYRQIDKKQRTTENSQAIMKLFAIYNRCFPEFPDN